LPRSGPVSPAQRASGACSTSAGVSRQLGVVVTRLCAKTAHQFGILVHDLGVIDRVRVGVGFVTQADASAKRCA
jgi:hypothetical protein